MVLLPSVVDRLLELDELPSSVVDFWGKNKVRNGGCTRTRSAIQSVDSPCMSEYNGDSLCVHLMESLRGVCVCAVVVEICWWKHV